MHCICVVPFRTPKLHHGLGAILSCCLCFMVTTMLVRGNGIQESSFGDLGYLSHK